QVRVLPRELSNPQRPNRFPTPSFRPRALVTVSLRFRVPFRGSGRPTPGRASHRRGFAPARGRSAQPLGVAQGRLAEEPPVLPAEVRRIVVAHPVSGGRGVDIAGEEEPPGLLQPELLLRSE